MILKFKLLAFIVIFLPVLILSQEVSDKLPFTIKINGQIKSDFFWDSRQTVSAREGHFLLYPAPVLNDANGQDINNHSNFNFLSIQSTIGLDLSGPKVLGALTSAKIEGDFFAQTNDNINLFRMRHAWLKFKWEKTELLFGQYWIPFFIPSCYPNTISFNTGAPIQAFGRNPQIRMTQNLGLLNFSIIASSQRDYSNTGPNGASGEYLRNSGIPALDMQFYYEKQNKEAATVILFGAGTGYKKIVPKIVNQNFKTDNGVKSLSGIAFFKAQLKAVTLKFEAIYGQNADDALMIGGYAVKSGNYDNSQTSYTPSTSLAYWTDIHSNGKKWQIGIFAGFSKNNGFINEISDPSTINGKGLNIESLFRVSPRISYSEEHIRFALETEYTSANYGSAYNNYGIPINTVNANNLRILFATYYFIK